MEQRLILILGGARSGKSSYAERLAAAYAHGVGQVRYVATAQALDEEMGHRIARHRQHRPETWQTIEEPLDLVAAISAGETAASVTIVDCLTLWLSNLIFGPDHSTDVVPNEDSATALARAAVDRLLVAYQQGTTSLILVSNEVGMGLVSPYPSGRLYCDLLGRVNAWIAAVADEVFLMVAGLPLPIHSLAKR